MSIFMVITYSFAAFLLTAVGLIFIIHKPRSVLVRILCGVLAGAIGWLWSVAAVFSLADKTALVLTARLSFVFAEFIPVFSMLFVLLFPETENGRRQRLTTWLALAWTSLLGMLTFATGAIIENLQMKGIDRIWIYGPAYRWLFITHFIVFSLATLAIIAVKLRRLDDRYRGQLVVYAIGWCLAMVVGSLTSIVLPSLGYYTSYLGPLASLIYVAPIVYVLIRREMIGVHLMGVEIFVLTFMAFQAVGFATATSDLHLIMTAVSVLLSALVGALILFGLWRNQQQRRWLTVLTEQLESSNSQLRQADQAKSEFISIASHQLRTPVSIIKGYLSLILEGLYGQVAGALRDKLDLMYGMNERLVVLINNLLNLSHIENGQVDFKCREIDVSALARRVQSDMLIETRGKDLALDFVEPKTAMPLVFADADKLYEILVNLVDNAIKYTAQGRVEISLTQADGHLIILVKDTGMGMNQEDKKRIFEKFFRPTEPSAARQAGMSLGLGLFVCAKLLESMGGRIWVEATAPGQGTTMAVSLPIKPVGACLADPVKKAPAAAEKTT